MFSRWANLEWWTPPFRLWLCIGLQTVGRSLYSPETSLACTQLPQPLPQWSPPLILLCLCQRGPEPRHFYVVIRIRYCFCQKCKCPPCWGRGYLCYIDVNEGQFFHEFVGQAFLHDGQKRTTRQGQQENQDMAGEAQLGGRATPLAEENYDSGGTPPVGERATTRQGQQELRQDIQCSRRFNRNFGTGCNDSATKRMVGK